MRRRFFALAVFCGTLGPCVALGDGFKGGKIFELESQQKKLLFTLQAELLAPDSKTRTFSSRYFDEKGRLAMTERASFKNLKLQSYMVTQEQLGESYELRVERARLLFRVTRAGRTDTSDMALPENLVIGPSFVPFLQAHWGTLQRQERVKAQLAVLDRRDTYGFEFKKVRETEFLGQPATVIRMSPVSIIVSAVVRPTYFTVTPDGARILEIRGRMLPKLRVGERWVDFDGDAVFIY